MTLRRVEVPVEQQAGVGARTDDVEATVVVDRSAIGQWSLVLEDGRTFDLWSTSVVVGRRPRQPSAGVQTLAIPDRELALSKTHARLDLVDGTWQVTDLGSTNGVVVAGSDGQDVEVERGGVAPVHGYLQLGLLGARIVPTAQADGTLPPARQSGVTVALASSEASASPPEPDEPQPATTSATGGASVTALPADHAEPTTELQEAPEQQETVPLATGAVDPTPDEGGGSTPTDDGTQAERETAVVRQLVAGTMPLTAFVRLLHRDLPLREYLAAGGGLEAYARADLLGQLLRTDWQDAAAVRQAQLLLERFLNDQGVAVDPTGLYQERVDFSEQVRPLLAELQPPWLKIPVPYVAHLLQECGDQADGDLDDLMRRRIETRFRFLTHPPRWLQPEYWPVGRHGPLVFVEQVEAVPERPGTAVSYVFVDPRNGAFLVLPQTRPELSADAATPASPEVHLLRGVVPVLARPGAFWIAQPEAHRRAPDGPTGDGGSAPAAGDTSTEPVPVQPEPSGLQTEPVSAAAPGLACPSAPVHEQPRDDQPVVDDQPGVVEPAVDELAADDQPSDDQPAVDRQPSADQPSAAPPLFGPAVPATVPVDAPSVSAEPAMPEHEDGDLEVTATKAPPSFRPWVLVLADGRTFSVESRSVVVGRRPRTDEPGTQALAIADSTRSLSKVHARLELIGDIWHVTDLGSTNGVVVTATDGQETKAEPGQPAPVYSYVAFGSVEARLQPEPPA